MSSVGQDSPGLVHGVVGSARVLAFGVSEMLPKTYGARTEIVYPINVQNPSGDTLRTDRILSTQLVAIKSRSVLAPVAKTYHMTPDALSKKIADPACRAEDHRTTDAWRPFVLKPQRRGETWSSWTRCTSFRRLGDEQEALIARLCRGGQ